MMFATGRIKELPATAAAENTTAPLSLDVPLKTEDRLPAASFDQVPDGQPVGAQRS